MNNQEKKALLSKFLYTTIETLEEDISRMNMIKSVLNCLISTAQCEGMEELSHVIEDCLQFSNDTFRAFNEALEYTKKIMEDEA